MAIADPVLVDVLHGEGGRELEGLPVGGLLDGAVAWGLHNRERDRLGLSEATREGNSVSGARRVSGGQQVAKGSQTQRPL